MRLFDLFKPLKKLTPAESRNAENAGTELRVNVEPTASASVDEPTRELTGSSPDGRRGQDHV